MLRLIHVHALKWKKIKVALQCILSFSLFLILLILCSFSPPKKKLFRYFHSSAELLARRGHDQEFGLKTQKREKFVRRDNKNQPPVEAPYVPPKPKSTIRSVPDKTIEIFDGMTIVELAKRSGESISRLQDILVNVGEKVNSEFDPLSIDVAELVAMVCLL